jgi:hypothetical protein
MKKNEKDDRNMWKTNENDDVRLLLTETFQGKEGNPHGSRFERWA